MSEKAKKILDVANRLFVEQGYRGTNMQSIADKAGISKGAIYLNFKSKEQILIALLKRMDDELLAKLDTAKNNQNLSAREKFKAQVKCQVDLTSEHRQLHELFIQDALAFTEELHTFASEARYRWQLAQQAAVAEYFGEKILPWQIDVSLIISGMLNEYASYWLIENVELPLDPAIEMVVFACDQLAQGLLEKTPPAVLTESMMPNMQSLEQEAEARHQAKIKSVASELLSIGKSLKPHTDKAEWQTLNQTLNLLEQQILAKSTDLVLVRALLASLREYPSLQDTRQEIARLFTVKLV